MKYMVFTDSDLDGVASFLTFTWFHEGHDIERCNTTITSFREDYTRWLSKNDPKNYDRIFVLDLDTHDHKDLVDTPQHFIIDHHKTHAEAEPYKKAKAVVKIYGSACKLVYKVFKTLYDKDITDPQKKLVLICDDYDSWTHALPQSKMLNILYWNTQNKFDTFLTSFADGFVRFNYYQCNIIKQQQDELNETLNNLNLYFADITVQKLPTKVFSLH